jgi:4-hydroxybenzoate polyprenyltransferase
MLAIQASIGALNDLVDAPVDAGRKPGKPIPARLVGRTVATAVVVLGAGIGVAVSAGYGPAVGLAALAGLGLGWAYDLRLSRTALSWLPLSLALPLLPIHAWLGAAGTVPPGLVALVPVAVLAGGGLALANGLADLERDASSGRHGAVVALGARRAWIVQTAALGAAAVLALLLAPAASVPGGGAAPADADALALLRLLRVGAVWAGMGGIALGAAVLRSTRAGARERGWELEAVGVACLGLGWLAGTAAAIVGGGAGG